jgi:hypothetical protein
MTRVALTFLLLVACKEAAPDRHGPTLTPLLADNLRALAHDCAIKPHRDGDVRELRLCKGPQAAMSIFLDGQRRIHSIETTVFSSVGSYEPKNLVEQAFRAVLTPAVLEAVTTRFAMRDKSETVTVDGVRVTVSVTQPPGAKSSQYVFSVTW